MASRDLDAEVLAIYKRLLGYATPHWAMFAAAIVGGVSLTLIVVFGPYVVQGLSATH